MKKWLDEWWDVAMPLAMLIILTFALTTSVNASPAAKYQPPGCTQFGIVGTVIIVRCVDDDGNVFFANSAGYMMPAGN